VFTVDVPFDFWVEDLDLAADLCYALASYFYGPAISGYNQEWMCRLISYDPG
jgi:hypothetical protein